MALNDPLRDENIKSAFSRVKKDILGLKHKIEQNKITLNSQKSLINSLLTEIKTIRQQIAKISQNK